MEVYRVKCSGCGAEAHLMVEDKVFGAQLSLMMSSPSYDPRMHCPCGSPFIVLGGD